MDKADVEIMNLEFLLSQHRTTPHKETPTMQPEPQIVDPQRVTVILSKETVDGIDAYRRVSVDLPTRSEAIRELLTKALRRGGKA
jgi:hypothetical protein